VTADIDSYLSDTPNATGDALRNKNANSSGKESQYNANYLLYSTQKEKKISLTLCLHNLRNVCLSGYNFYVYAICRVSLKHKQ